MKFFFQGLELYFVYPLETLQSYFKGHVMLITLNCQLVFQHFSFGPPLETLKKKVVEMSSNFERLHEIINQAHPESFIILS